MLLDTMKQRVMTKWYGINTHTCTNSLCVAIYSGKNSANKIKDNSNLKACGKIGLGSGSRYFQKFTFLGWPSVALWSIISGTTDISTKLPGFWTCAGLLNTRATILYAHTSERNMELTQNSYSCTMAYIKTLHSI